MNTYSREETEDLSLAPMPRPAETPVLPIDLLGPEEAAERPADFTEMTSPALSSSEETLV